MENKYYILIHYGQSLAAAFEYGPYDTYTEAWTEARRLFSSNSEYGRIELVKVIEQWCRDYDPR
jgi:hypothetical protein